MSHRTDDPNHDPSRCTCCYDVPDLRAEVASLRAALVRYGDHLDDCPVMKTCTCGFDAALAGRGPEARGEPVEVRGGLTVRAGAPVCTVCRDDDTTRPDCRACHATGLDNLEDVRPDAKPSPDVAMHAAITEAVTRWTTRRDVAAEERLRGLLEAVDAVLSVLANVKLDALDALAAKRKEWP